MNEQNQTAVSPLVKFKQNFTRMADAESFALPSNVSPEAFKNAAIVAVQDNPAIFNCDDESIFKSLRTLAAAGLVPDGREAALVPFSTRVDGQYVKKCQAMPMVFGLIKSIRRSGEISDVRAHIVYQNEIDQKAFTYTQGDREALVHSPILFGERGKAVAAYSIVTMKDGSISREFMTAEDIEKVRRTSSAQKIYARGQAPKQSEEPIGIWKDHEPEMWKKTVIRRHCKRLDMSSEDMRRVMVEQDSVPIKDVTPEPVERKNLAQQMQEAQEPVDTYDPPEDVQDVEEAEAIEAIPLEELNLEEAFPGDDRFTEGVNAFQSGKPVSDCPYTDQEAATHWVGGWTEAEKAA